MPNTPVDYTPSLSDYTEYPETSPFLMCCMENFPFIEEDFDSLTYYEMLCKIVDHINKFIVHLNTTESNVEAMETNINSLLTAYNQLQSYVNNYFQNLDVQQEINNKLDEMATSGTLLNIMRQTIVDTTTDYLANHVQTEIFDTYDSITETEKANFPIGLNFKTLGYHTVNDEGGAIYKVTATKDVLAIQEEITPDAKYIEQIINDGFVSLAQLGAIPNQNVDSIIARANASRYNIRGNDSTNSGLYYINNSINFLAKFIKNLKLQITDSNIKIEACRVYDSSFHFIENRNTVQTELNVKRQSIFKNCKFKLETTNTTSDLLTLVVIETGGEEVSLFENCSYKDISVGLKNTSILLNIESKRNIIINSEFWGGKDSIYFEPLGINNTITNCTFIGMKRYIADIDSTNNILTNLHCTNDSDLIKNRFNIRNNKTGNIIECTSIENPTTNPEPIYNNQIEVIENANGTAIKYENGTLICFGKKVLTIDISTARGSLFTGSINASITFPVAFLEKPNVSYGRLLNNSNPSVVWIGSIFYTENKIETVTGLSSVSTSAENINLSYIAIGKWK